jgi:hypothetical protein
MVGLAVVLGCGVLVTGLYAHLGLGKCCDSQVFDTEDCSSSQNYHCPTCIEDRPPLSPDTVFTDQWRVVCTAGTSGVCAKDTLTPEVWCYTTYHCNYTEHTGWKCCFSEPKQDFFCTTYDANRKCYDSLLLGDGEPQYFWHEECDK